ncbi:MAG: RdgB/HAM1 family non-canonical purine NTP pyrophosphatase [Oscillospiraceae bacterium]|nr:RdgB/HAM1 family non-canonical purine NTP pyrophosphatase [Oscillospiraceae bacterium]
MDKSKDILVFASGNAHKLEEVRAILTPILPGIKIISMREAGFDGEIEENGNSFSENAFIKARAVRDKTGMTAFADDSGLVCRALDGEPGIYSARYAARNGLSTSAGANEDNLSLLSERIAGKADRSAKFVCSTAIAFAFAFAFTIATAIASGSGFKTEENDFCVNGECSGRIIDERRGKDGFGYDPVFLSDELGKTLAEATPEEKNSVSHRGRALRAFADEYRRLCSVTERGYKL